MDYDVIIDSGSSENVIATEIIEKLKLKMVQRHHPYKVS